MKSTIVLSTLSLFFIDFVKTQENLNDRHYKRSSIMVFSSNQRFVPLENPNQVSPFMIPYSIDYTVVNPFGNGQNQPESYDSLKHSFLPKYEIYVRYFNPLQISKTIYSYDIGFKFYRQKKRYLSANFIARASGPMSYYELITISQMYRLTPKKIDWIHFELSYGLALSHRYNVPVIYIQNSFGFGGILRNEIQFDIGSFSNISLGTYLSPQITYSFRRQYLNSPVPENGFSTIIYSEIPPIFYVGFNLYLK